jgi:hypothetical protein
MTDRRITETNPKIIFPKRRWYDKIRDEFASLGKELDKIAEAYSNLEQIIQKEESSPEFLPTPGSAVSFAYVVTQHYLELKKLPELLQKYTLPLVRHLKDVKKEKSNGPDKALQQRGERISSDLLKWSEQFNSLYESRWYRKGLTEQMEELSDLVQQGKNSPEKYAGKIKNAWQGGLFCSGVRKNIVRLYVLMERLSAYQLALDKKIDEKYGKPFEKLSKGWAIKAGD